MADKGAVLAKAEIWPELPPSEWADTLLTVHRWTQIIGKIRLKLAPMLNHWWQVPLYVTSRGLTTSPMSNGTKMFQIDLDFIDNQMYILCDSGERRSVVLKPRSVADFYRETMSALASLGIEVRIWTTPVEVPDRTPFELDEKHASYKPEYVQRFWRILLHTQCAILKFRSDFIGKASPVHFFWGAFDLACSRFSGRRAPEHPGAPNVGRFVAIEAYSHEVSSCGFWPGPEIGTAAFYAYAYPEPTGFREFPIQPKEAQYHKGLSEFILPYDAVRTADSPEEKLLSFFQTTYEAAAILGRWDRGSLERR